MKAAFLDYGTLGPGIDTASLDQLVEVEYYDYSPPNEISGRLRDVEIGIVNKARVDAATMVANPGLKFIVLAATGSDNVDLQTARQRSIAVANIRNYCTPAVVQHVFALILALTRQLKGYQTVVNAGAWQRSNTFALFDFPIRELTGKTLGIVGYGSLGRGVADVGRAFGMEVLIAARPGAPAENRIAIDALLEQADVLSLHCPLTDSNRHMIGKSELASMKPDALLINTARGALIDSAALVEALRSGGIGGAGIDVLATEPPTDEEPLLAADIPNLILTPHIAWTASESRQRTLDQVAENVKDFLDSGELRRLA
ncbi:MAG: D-2-hydroxyacid dehydrogenase [Gammaproteobacteria bacterium]|jgi:glycerate dehydrogenase